MGVHARATMAHAPFTKNNNTGNHLASAQLPATHSTTPSTAQCCRAVTPLVTYTAMLSTATAASPMDSVSPLTTPTVAVLAVCGTSTSTLSAPRHSPTSRSATARNTALPDTPTQARDNKPAQQHETQQERQRTRPHATPNKASHTRTSAGCPQQRPRGSH
jgi:hypothetical protein